MGEKHTGWQPIETAPREKRVLVWTDTDNPEDRGYVREICEGRHVQCAQVGILCEEGDWDLGLIGQPTHWMPLPDAPATPTDTKPAGEGV